MCREKCLSKSTRSAPPDYKLNSLHFLAGVTIERGEIPRSQALNLTLPSGIGNLDAQHAIGKLESPRALGHDRPADQGPGEHRGFALRRAPQRVRHNLFQYRGCVLQ